jgi:alginate O-acetyltransferase complex protein AlgI
LSFASLAFIAFAGGFFVLWPLVKSHRTLRYLYLVLSSLVFYGWSDWRLLLVLLPVGAGTYVLGLAVDSSERLRKPLLILSLTLVISALAVFKYSAFLSLTLEQILSGLGLHARLRPPLPFGLHLLPLGISFYTFQALSYLIDVYRRQLRACRDPLQFLAYFSLFPNLIAGPIVRARMLLPQLESPGPTAEAQRWEGLRLIAFGYFKKVVIADNLVSDVTQAFAGGAGSGAALYWWSVMAAYAFYIYFDFSGYSDIARGLARWIGFETPLNFDHPYTANSVSGFWSRWHMTLSQWIRDYLFLPISYACMKRLDRDRILGIKVDYLVYSWATMVTMILCGLWHGAAWTFVLWGAAHGFFLILERVTRWPRRLKRLPFGRVLGVLLVLLQVWTAWVLFRAESLGQAWGVIKRMYGAWGGWEWGLGAAASIALALGLVREVVVLVRWRPRWWPVLSRMRWLGPAGIAALILASILFRGPGGSFVYFRF